MRGADLHPNISCIMDEAANTRSFGIGRKNAERVDCAVLHSTSSHVDKPQRPAEVTRKSSHSFRTRKRNSNERTAQQTASSFGNTAE